MNITEGTTISYKNFKGKVFYLVHLVVNGRACMKAQPHFIIVFMHLLVEHESSSLTHTSQC